MAIVFRFLRAPSSLVYLLTLEVILGLLCSLAFGQSAPAVHHGLITQAVDESRVTVLKGNTHRLARPEFDLGTAPATLAMQRMLLVLKRSPQQEFALRKMLDDQQDRHSSNYHKWVTPEQFGKKFGPSDEDMQKIVAWLQSHGFQVGSTKGRTVLEFSGSASQVQEAFHTTIHKYVVNGEQHWANSSDPAIPTALTPAVAGVFTLHNFIKKPTLHSVTGPIPATLVPGKKPQVTFTQNGQFIHALSPQDYGVIYNINSVNSAGGGNIAVVGRSNLYNGGQDISSFTSVFGAGGFRGVVVDGPDPGDLGGGEEAEATLDSTWSAALAPNSNVYLVVSATTDTTDGIDLSEVYIIEQNLAGIMTESFSACELYATDTQLAGASALAEQAAAQGITYIVSTGDDGAAGCDDPSAAPAQYPISVNYLASTAYNVAVGGTMFNENGQDSKYWTTTAPVAETALSYIPENVWNESSLSNGLWAGSGGASAGNIASGVGTTAGVPKPNWQYGSSLNIPADGVRDLPDVSLTAASHDPYLLCLEGSCTPNSQGQFFVYFISGTSASAPSFAGIMAQVTAQNSLVTGDARLGVPNYILYRLAATQTAYPSSCNGSNTATAPGSTCIFNDITVGNNVVPGEIGNQYQAGPAYDLATGLGSVNVTNLVNQWNSVTFNPTSTDVTLGLTTIAHGTAMPFTITVTPNSAGMGAPTGDAFLYAQGSFGYSPAPTTIGPFSLSGGTISSSTNALPGGTYFVSAGYSGDDTFAPSTSAGSTVFTVTPEPSTTTVRIETAGQNGNPVPFTSGPFGSFVYLRADVAGQSGFGFPTGSVTFNDTFGTIPGGSVFPLNIQGNTENGTVYFDTGTHTISASYSGDSSFNASNTTESQTFTITPGFFAMINSASNAIVISAPGGSGSASLTVASSTGFSGTIVLACTGLPSEASCAFSPGSIAASGTPTQTNVGIYVSTTAATAKLGASRATMFASFGLGIGLLGFLPIGGQRGRAARASSLLAMLVALVVVPGCGGGSSSNNNKTPANAGTPTGQYNITVTATSGSAVSQTGFVLVLQ